MVSINAKLLEQKKAFNYHWIGLEQQHGRRDVMCKALNNVMQIPFFGGVNLSYKELEYDLPAWDIVVTSKSETNKCILGIVTQI